MPAFFPLRNRSSPNLSMPAKPQDESDAPLPAPGLVHRLKSLLRGLVASRLRLAVVVGAAVVIVMGGIATLMMIPGSKVEIEKPVTLTMALTALDRGDRAEAKRLAEKLLRKNDLSTEDWGGPDFVLGVLQIETAADALEKQKPDAYLAAAKYLEESYNRGFPAGRESTGLYLLGKSLCLGGRPAAARSVLQAALKTDPTHKTEISQLLVQAWLAENPPALDRALAENEQVLADKELTADQRSEGLLRRAQILFRMDRFAECTATLDKIPHDSEGHYRVAAVAGEVAVLRGRMLLREAQKLKTKPGASATDLQHAHEKFMAAIEAFRTGQSEDTADNRATRQAMYLTGLCMVELGDNATAMARFARTSKLFGDVPEGLAATFQQAELARRMERYPEALAAYRHVLATIGKPENFHNPWVSIKELRGAVLAACEEFLAKGKPELAAALCRKLEPLFSKAQALETTAHVCLAWGQSLVEQADTLPPDRSEDLRRQGRVQFRRAGGIYADLAKLEVASRQYPDQLWNSAAAYLDGHDYQNAVRMLKAYLNNETRTRHAQGLTDLGDALISLGQWDKALEALQQCLDQHPRDAVVYRARLLASKAAAAQGDNKRAETLLRENLNGEQLTPASKEWRESLFALGELLHSQNQYSEAIRRLEEAVERYPNAPQATQARYLAADAARRRATALRAGLVKEISAKVRAENVAEANRLLEKALDHYRALEAALSPRDANDMTVQDKALLRNCRFTIGETHFDLEQYESALRAYQSAANRYPNSPEVLNAYVQIANVYRRLDRPAEARTSLEQARLALRRIPSDARFEDTTVYNRKQWGEVLDWLCSL